MDRRLRPPGLGAVVGRRPAGRPRPVGVGRPSAAWPCCPTCARGWPEGPRSATAATGPWPSCSGPDGVDAPVAAELGGPRRGATPSSSTGGGPRGSPTRRCGRSGSARRSTSRWSRPPRAEALKRAGVVAADVDHVAVAGLHARAVQAVRSGRSAPVPTRWWPTGRRSSGNLGAAQAGMLLADAPRAGRAPGALIALVVVADGADVFVLRATDALPSVRADRASRGAATVAESAAPAGTTCPTPGSSPGATSCGGSRPVGPDPERPGAPATWRVHALEVRVRRPATAGRAASATCPPSRVCLRCRTIDEMDPVRMADVRGRVATFTVDHLAYSPVAPGGRGRGGLRRGWSLPRAR